VTADWQDEPVCLATWSPEWAARAERWLDELDIVLATWRSGGREHVGSTSVPGLMAKPIVDLLVGVRRIEGLEAADAPLARAGWHHVPIPSPHQEVRRHYVRAEHGRRAGHLHLVVPGQATWSTFLEFRERLREDPALVRAYGRTKAELAVVHHNERLRYTDSKAGFIEDALRGGARGAAPIPLPFANFWRSSASWRVRWALLHKRVAFTSISVDLGAGAQHDPEHRRRNPIGHVPAIEIAPGRWLGESMAILEWLEDSFPDPPLFPSDPWGKARVRQLCETINAGVQPLQNLAVLERAAPDQVGRVAWARHFVTRGLTAYEELLGAFESEGRGAFSWGDRLSAADLFLVPQVAAARRWGVDLEPLPRVRAVDDAARATPHAEAAHLHGP
jgi:maleylacetoacetate isomerase